MIEPFAATVASWNNFYLLAGGAAATLVGLLFVAVAQHIELLTDPTAAAILSLAQRTFFHFVYVVIISLLFLVPSQTPHGLGIALFCIGGLDVLSQVRLIFLSRRERGNLRTMFGSDGKLTRVLAQPLFTSAALLWVAARVYGGDVHSIYFLTAAVGSFLISGATDAWKLMFGLAHARRRLTQPAERGQRSTA